MSTANGASDATMANVGRNATEMESVGALSREYRLPWAAP